jgi:hypothetical protein
LNAITDLKLILFQVSFHLTPHQLAQSSVDVYIGATKAVRLAHKLCDECEKGQLPFMHRTGFDEFIALAEKLKLNTILEHLDGHLEDFLMEDMDGVLARIYQCAISYRLRIGRALCDVAPFGALLESIQMHDHLFPVRVFHHLNQAQHLNPCRRQERMTGSTSFNISPISVSSLWIH